MERRLAAILAADVSGYSRLMAADEESTLSTLNAFRRAIDERIKAHSGRIFGSAGDSVIAEFVSPVEAVRCAVEIQQHLEELNAALDEDRQMRFRIGVNLGDVMAEGDNLHGDGVNIAARLEAIAPPGGVCISKQVAEHIGGNLDVTFANAGHQDLKNIAKPLEVWVWPPDRAATMRHVSKGWRRAAAVAALAAVAMAAGAYYVVESDSTRELPTGPRIALIPFNNIGSNPDDAFFSEGLSRDINAHLSKFSNLFVIAPSSVSSFRGNADCETIRNELQADYILEGTVRRSGNHLRVTTTFTDAKTCRQLDAPGPFDRDLSVTSVLDVQLEIAKTVVAQIGSADAPLFNTHIQSAIRRKAPDSLQAYECVMLVHWWAETFAPERLRKARACLERTLESDPDYSIGWSSLAQVYNNSKKYSIDTPPDWAELSRAAADRAIAIDPDNPRAYYALAILSQMLGEDKTVLQNFATRAIDLNPNDAFVLADLATWMAYTGEWKRGKEWVTRAKQLNPNYQSWWDWIWLLEHYLNGEYAQARDVGLKINLPGNYIIQAAMTATYGMLGDQQKAEQALAHLLEIKPEYPQDPRAPYRSRAMQPELIEALMDGLRKAGLEVPPAG